MKAWLSKHLSFSQVTALVVASFLVPLLAMPLPRYVAVVLSILAIVLFVGFPKRLQFVYAVHSLLFALIAIFLTWMAVSIIWSPFPMTAAGLSVVKIAGTCLAGFIAIAAACDLDEEGSRRVADALATGVAAASLVLLSVYLVERGGAVRDVQGSFLFARHFDRGATVASILLWPAIYGLVRRDQGRAAVGLFLITSIAVGISYSLAAKAALIAATFAAAISWKRPKSGTIATGILMVAIFIAMPFVGSAIPSHEVTAQWKGINPSTHHRLTIWKHVSELISADPWIGHGIETSRILGNKQSITAYLPGRPPVTEALLPLHPHNTALQIYLELGAIGALIGGAALTVIIWRIARSSFDRLYSAASLATFASIYSIAMLSYGAWQTWWLSTILCSVVFMLAIRSKSIP